MRLPGVPRSFSSVSRRVLRSAKLLPLFRSPRKKKRRDSKAFHFASSTGLTRANSATACFISARYVSSDSPVRA